MSLEEDCLADYIFLEILFGEIILVSISEAGGSSGVFATNLVEYL